MPLFNRYITLLLLLMCSFSSFSQSKKPIPTIYIPYADTISQELVDSIYRQEGKYILSYHPQMAHLIPDLRCRRKPTPGRRIGVFSVAKDRQVSFSQGNLQYVRSRAEWRFADNQWDYIGANNIVNGRLGARIDLFGWSSDNLKVSFGVSASTNAADYRGNFVDWGENEIQGDEPNTWRTLSADEWEYLINGRKNASDQIAVAQVNGVNGVIVLPDNCILPDELIFKSGIATKEGTEYYKTVNNYSLEQWKLLESIGVVFLPAAGRREGQNVTDVERYSNIWASTIKNSEYSFYFANKSITIYVDALEKANKGRSVRLVHDTIVPPPAPCETFEVNGVTFNMMCVEGGTFTMGKGKDEHQVTLSDYYIGETEVTQGLWKAVMGVDNLKGQNVYGDDYPVASVSLSECETFVQRLSQLTGRHFRIPTEAEWEYVARGGQKSKGFTYAGSDSIGEVAWYKDNMTESQPHPIAQLKPNELGTYDMTGNMAEWVSDWYAPYNLYPQINPTGAAIYDTTLSYPLTYRGGCWTQPVTVCNPIHRALYYNRAVNGIGLRLAMSDEEPFRAVYVNDTTRFYLRLVKGEKYDYYIGQTEVPQILWKAVMGYNNSIFVGDNLPVEKVSWDECQLFIQKLNDMTGLHFRLPTESEWEYAAQGGIRSNGYTYAGSNHIDSIAWYGTNSQQTTHAVASLMPNELGIYDMTGNVWEWCQDFYGDDLTMHVVKSGSFVDAASVCRINSSTGRTADWQSYIGLRLVLDVENDCQATMCGSATTSVSSTHPSCYEDGPVSVHSDL